MTSSPAQNDVVFAEETVGALNVDSLLAENAALIARIKLCFGVDHATFAEDVLPLIRAYAAYVGWLPATASDFFSRPGGLFELGLETGFYAVQGTDAHIFSGRQTISVRRHLEPRWRAATFIAGLCAELHRALGTMTVLDASGGSWPAYLGPLTEWLARRHRWPCRLRWHPATAGSRSLGLLAVTHVVPSATFQHLGEHNDQVVPQLLASIGGLPLYRGRNVLDALVRRSLAIVVKRDLQSQGKQDPGAAFAHHQAHYLVDGLQRLVVGESSWQPNHEKSRVWYSHDGLFLVWPGAAHDLHKLLEGEQIVGMPDAPDAILKRLRDSALIEVHGDGASLWRIRPPGTTEPLQAVKIASPALLLSSLDADVAPLGDGLSIEVPKATPPTHDDTNQQGSTKVPPEPPPTPTPDAAATSGWRLKAPLRLNAAVRHALAAILAEQSDHVIRLPDERLLFIPLHLFQDRGIAPAIAIRALSELTMIAPGTDGTPTVRHVFAGGEDSIGVHLKERFAESSCPSTPLLSEEAAC